MPDSLMGKENWKRELEVQEKPLYWGLQGFLHSDIKGYFATICIEILIANLLTSSDTCFDRNMVCNLQYWITSLYWNYPLCWITAAQHYRQKKSDLILTDIISNCKMNCTEPIFSFWKCFEINDKNKWSANICLEVSTLSSLTNTIAL